MDKWKGQDKIVPDSNKISEGCIGLSEKVSCEPMTNQQESQSKTWGTTLGRGTESSKPNGNMLDVFWEPSKGECRGKAPSKVEWGAGEAGGWGPAPLHCSLEH